MVAALDALCGSVDGEFTKAVANSWDARNRVSKAESNLEKLLEIPDRTIKRFVRRYLNLRIGEAVAVDRRNWYVNYNKGENGGREAFTAHLSFIVRISPGITINVSVSPHKSATKDRAVTVLLRTLDRVQAMVEASR